MAAAGAAAAGDGPELGDIIRLNDLFHESALLHLGVSSRLFDHLREPVTAEVVASAAGWVPWKAGIVLDALVASGLVRKTGDGAYVNAPTTDRLLVSTSREYVGAIVDHQRLQWSLWGRMGEVLASDETVAAQQEVRLRKDATANEAFQRAMVQLSRDNVRDVLAVDDFARCERVLDICGGHGTYLASLAARHPRLTGEVWDLETARDLAVKTFAELGVTDRVRFRAVDVLDGNPFAGHAPCDACMLNDCLHYFAAADVDALVGQAAAALRGGGLLLVLTMTLEADRVTPPSAAGFSLHMMLNTRHGQLHPTAWIAELMVSQGLAVESRPLGSLGRYTMLIGRKPASTPPPSAPPPPS